MSQAQLAKKLELDQSTVSRIEGGEFIPSASVARALMDLLGVSLDDVIEVDDSSKRHAS
jgi:ribosome-binding protein aMBF1 (putative translation factor)